MILGYLLTHLHALIQTIGVISTVVLFAFLYRNRGMHHKASWDGTTVNRLISWELPVTLYMLAVCIVYGYGWRIGLLCGLGSLLIMIGHGFAQSFGWKQYLQMGLVNATRLLAILSPFLLANHYYTNSFSVLWLIPPASFLLFTGASALSYQPVLNTKTLRLFGVDWCVPGDSSWEEFLNGAVFGSVFSSIFAFVLINTAMGE
jgi:hypothetical protein